ncbi:MAG: hypothetical protein U5K74_11580 [Gemmatimonadaceae bacterium]|nr:hypothetical protein [Gemmatimonadaceae bacterium]
MTIGTMTGLVAHRPSTSGSSQTSGIIDFIGACTTPLVDHDDAADRSLRVHGRHRRREHEGHCGEMLVSAEDRALPEHVAIAASMTLANRWRA